MSATDYLDSLSVALTEGRPIVLLLGQDAWRSGTRVDPILEAALKRANRDLAESAAPSFSCLLQANPLPEDFYEWLADMYFQQPEPLWMEVISQLPLNAVFTSSIDPSIARSLRVNGRDVELILSPRDNPAAPRNRKNLHLTYIFGCAGERDPTECPPKSYQELRRRTAMYATPLLSRLVDVTTSLGILLIDGVNCSRDWLDMDTLSGIISAFAPNQVYWFGSDSEEIYTDMQSLQDLATPHGPIVFIKERLSAALKSLESAHKIDISSARQFASEGTVTINDSILEIEPAMRLKISTAASIVEDTWISTPPIIGSEIAYVQFRRFHGQVEDARRLVEGIRRGFAIERIFEHELWKRVHRALSKAGSKQQPILIHGQSGSGKSFALARLANRIREDSKYPVLFSSRAFRVPAVEEIDDFCLRAEEVGADATLVICDANLPMSRYSDLLRGFVSRGRRVVVVGSTYRIIDESDDHNLLTADHVLEAPTELQRTESESLLYLVSKWTGENLHTDNSEYLLPAIYRILPEVRSQLAAGLAREARAWEDDLRYRGTTNRTTLSESENALGQAIIDAGLVRPKELLEQKLDSLLGVMTDTASLVIDYVMVPGKLDCPVPVNLLMRAVGGNDNVVDIVALFSGIDLFRWSSNDEDDVFVHPRLRVEAELISTRRLGTAQAEIEIALRLLENANPGDFGSCERRFVLDFVHKLGPDGPFGRRYKRHYLEIARALTEMRNRRGVRDPSIMLQEATLRRRVFRDNIEFPDTDAAAILDEARQIVELALDEFCTSTVSGLRRACANLKVERAAIYGFRATQRMRSGASDNEVWQFYVAARDSVRNAMFAADSYIVHDISVWVPSDLLRDGQWDFYRNAELLADIWDGLERIDQVQLDSDQQERLEERRIKVAQTLRDSRLEQDALDTLERLGSRAGILLKAREIGGFLLGSDKVTEDDISNANNMISFMRNHEDKIHDDGRCLRYFLRGIWLVATKHFLFNDERSPIPEQDHIRQEILTILDEINNLEGVLGDPKIQYLRAVLMWRNRRANEAIEIWKSLSRETAFSDPRRVIRHHVWTEAEGRPKLFYGRIVADRQRGSRGSMRVRVEGLRQDIDLLPRDFPNLDMRNGATISGGFYIAFNFIGPIADPPRRLGDNR